MSDIFNTPTLGHPVRLGELYDQRTGRFIGVQLYPEDKIKEIVTQIPHTTLSLSLSTTHKDKATLLDIDARLSLDVLSGLVSVSGSASYLNDEKSNTQEYAYAMSLKTRLTEKRISFLESEVADNIIKGVVKDYVMAGRATHLVSSIVYGGSLIVNLVAKKSEFSEDEAIEGNLEARLEKLKGAISLEGEASVEIKNQFKDMNDKFDLVMHGDVALDDVPINPMDVLHSFTGAAKFIKESGGVPVSVTLQPIPRSVHDIGHIHQLDGKMLDILLSAFTNLDDLRSRFKVLEDGVKKQSAFVPELTRIVRDVAQTYTNDYSELLHKLGTYLRDHRHGKKPDHELLLSKATKLQQEHLNPEQRNEEISKQYPSSLAGLENHHSRFQSFVRGIQKEKKVLQTSLAFAPTRAILERLLRLSSIDEVAKSIIVHRQTPLFVMISLSDAALNPIREILKFLAIVQKYAGYFVDSTSPPYLVYAENLDILDQELSNEGNFHGVNRPSVFLGHVDDEGNLTWKPPPNVPELPTPNPSSNTDVDFPMYCSSEREILMLDIDPVDGRQSFSIQIRAREAKEFNESADPHIVFLGCVKDDSWFLSIRNRLTIYDEFNRRVLLEPKKRPTLDGLFMGTFVQDIQNKLWTLYLDGEEVARRQITDDDIIVDAEKLRVCFHGDLTTRLGELLDFKGFARALTKEEVEALNREWER